MFFPAAGVGKESTNEISKKDSKGSGWLSFAVTFIWVRI